MGHYLNEVRNPQQEIQASRRRAVPVLLVAAWSTAVTAGGSGDDQDTISVTASRIKRATGEVAASLSVIDARKIEQARMFNVKDGIQGTPGVLIQA
jgi:iron complex outermembrane receptor protein